MDAAAGHQAQPAGRSLEVLPCAALCCCCGSAGGAWRVVLCCTSGKWAPSSRCCALTAELCSLLLLEWAPCCCLGRAVLCYRGEHAHLDVHTHQPASCVGVWVFGGGVGALVLQSTAAVALPQLRRPHVEAAVAVVASCSQWQRCSVHQQPGAHCLPGGLQRAVPGVVTRTCCGRSSGRSGGRQPVRGAFYRQST